MTHHCLIDAAYNPAFVEHEMMRPLKVFLYHAPGDRDAVRNLYLHLIKDGVDAWLVKEKLLPSQDWKFEIRQAIREADVVIICLSERFDRGELRRKEVQAAFDAAIEQLDGELFIVAARLEQCDEPANLRKWQSLDLFEKAGYEMLMQILQARADQIGAAVQRKESSLPEVPVPGMRREEATPDEIAVDTSREIPEVLVEGPSLLIEGMTVELQGSRTVSRRKPRRVLIPVLIVLAGIVVAAVLSPIPLDRLYQLALAANFGQVIGSSAAKVPKPTFRTAHANIIFLIDTSNSMQGQKIRMVKSAVSDFISKIDDRYLVSIIEFDTNVERQMSLTSDHADASDEIQSIGADFKYNDACSYDALYAGIQETAFAPIATDTKNVIILLTDASYYENFEANCSFQSISDIQDLVKKYPVSISIIHMSASDNYLVGIVMDTGGKFFSTDTEKEIDKALRSISEKNDLALDTKSPTSAFAATTSPRRRPAVFVLPGEFSMGNGNKVSLDAFWIDKTEVTNGMYAECVQAGQCSAPRSTSSRTRNSYYGNSAFDDYPVIFVSWMDAHAYCTWAGGRLPTEAEWEKAARGTDGRQFPWGSSEPRIGLLSYQAQDTARVGIYPDGASPYGALDMAGNVAEWVADWYSLDEYNHPIASNPSGPDAGQYRVWRGGSWANNTNEWIRTYSRTGNPPTDVSSGLGFRCARDASP